MSTDIVVAVVVIVVLCMCVVVLCICVVVFGYTCVLFCLLAFILQYNTKSSLANSLSLAIKGQKEGLVVSFICCYCFIGIFKYNKMVLVFVDGMCFIW